MAQRQACEKNSNKNVQRTGAHKGKKRRQWDTADVLKALAAFRQGQSAWSASMEFRFHRKALTDRLNKKVISDEPELGNSSQRPGAATE